MWGTVRAVPGRAVLSPPWKGARRALWDKLEPVQLRSAARPSELPAIAASTTPWRRWPGRCRKLGASPRPPSLSFWSGAANVSGRALAKRTERPPRRGISRAGFFSPGCRDPMWSGSPGEPLKIPSLPFRPRHSLVATSSVFEHFAVVQNDLSIQSWHF